MAADMRLKVEEGALGTSLVRALCVVNVSAIQTELENALQAVKGGRIIGCAPLAR